MKEHDSQCNSDVQSCDFNVPQNFVRLWIAGQFIDGCSAFMGFDDRKKMQRI